MPSKRPAAKLRLPSFATFAAWPLAKRTALFARWLKAQPRRRRYDWDDTIDCPLGQFATALHRAPAQGAVNDIMDLPIERYGHSDLMEVFPMDDGLPHTLQHNVTFGAASDAFHAALKATS